MATVAKQLEKTGGMPVDRRINSFSAETLKAPFLLRCAALFVDYMILLALPISWLVAGRLFGETGSTPAVGGVVWFLSVLLVLVNLIGLPALRGQSIGKMVAGLTIVKSDGTRVDFTAILFRNLLGYFLTVLTGGIGFLGSAFDRRGRALHDAIGGTVIIRGRQTQI